jgi:phage terminase large subunit GpA-like protein
MDAGSRVAWPARIAPGDLSAIQHAWNLRIDRGEAAFQAEFQNQPTIDDMASDKLDKRSLATRVVPIARGVIPANHTTLTAYVDVQERLLYWAVCSWSASFGGHLVAYGAYPDQGSSFFEAQTAKRTLASAAKGSGFEAALRTGLDALMPLLLGREWVREDGAKMRIGRLLVDAAWGRSTQVVRNFARQTPFASIVLPSQGKGIGATSKPMAGRRGRGDQVGLNWIVGTVDGVKQRQAFVDTNFWKTFTASRLKMAVGDPEGITIHDGAHELLFEHLVSEYPVTEEAKAQGRRVDVWKKGLGENHWWDCLVGAACAASISGVTPASSEAGGRVRRKVEAPAAAGGRKRIVVKRANR